MKSDRLWVIIFPVFLGLIGVYVWGVFDTGNKLQQERDIKYQSLIRDQKVIFDRDIANLKNEHVREIREINEIHEEIYRGIIANKSTNIFGYIQKINPNITDEDTANFTRQVYFVCRQEGADPVEIFAIADQESRFVSTARSKKGAIGYLQVMPQTFKNYRSRYHYNQWDLYNWKACLRVGIRCFVDLRKKYGYETALAIYNAGNGNGFKNIARPYVEKVICSRGRIAGLRK
jgi:hypothetical protein